MWSKYARLLSRFVVVSFRDMSEFRLDFATSLLHNLIYQAIFIIFWKSIITFSGALGEWSFPDLVVLSTFSLLSAAIMQWFAGFLHLSNKVLRGEVDRYLCRPISPLFALLAEQMNGLASAQQTLSGVAILAAVCLYFHLAVTPLAVAGSLAVLAVGCVVVVLIQGSIGLLTFWLGDVSRLHSLFLISGEFEKYPVDLFPAVLRNALIWVIPIGLIATYPALIFLGRVELTGGLLAVGALLVAVWSLIFQRLWAKALVRYESFGG